MGKQINADNLTMNVILFTGVAFLIIVCQETTPASQMR